MFKYQIDQRCDVIADVQFGGQPGSKRTVVVGSVFYPRHSIVKNPMEGKVDIATFESRLSAFLDMADRTSCPAALMMYCESDIAARNYLDILTDRFSGPVFIDSASTDIRLRAAGIASEMGLLDRTIYNTINAGSTPEEMEALKGIGVKNAVALAFNPRDQQVKGRIYMLENGNGIAPKGLIDMANEAGVEHLLLDMAVTAADQNAGAALRAILVSKAKWGLPSGCALHNAVECWSTDGLSDPKDATRHIDSGAVAMSITAGADYVVFGPFEYAKRIMPVAAFADQMVAQAVKSI